MPFSSQILNGLALIYGALVKTRNTLYDSGVLKAVRAPLLVVSVGNIEAAVAVSLLMVAAAILVLLTVRLFGSETFFSQGIQP